MNPTLPFPIAGHAPLRLLLQFSLALSLVCGPALLADTVVLTNGDKFTGEIRKLHKGELSIKLKYADDPLVMDWKMVASVTTEKPLKVTLDNGKELSAKLEPAKEPGQFLAVGTTTPVELKTVVKVEPAVPKTKGFDDRFATDTSFTYDYTGASAFQNLVWYTNIAYYGDKWEPLLLLNQNFNRAKGPAGELPQLWNVERQLLSDQARIPVSLAGRRKSEGRRFRLWHLCSSRGRCRMGF